MKKKKTSFQRLQRRTNGGEGRGTRWRGDSREAAGGLVLLGSPAHALRLLQDLSVLDVLGVVQGLRNELVLVERREVLPLSKRPKNKKKPMDGHSKVPALSAARRPEPATDPMHDGPRQKK